MTDIATLGIAVDSRKVGQARDELGRFVKSAGDAERATLGLNTATAALAAAMAAATAATSKLVSVQREFDRLNAGLITVTGSAEAAARAFAQLEKLAADTPFSLQQVTQAFTKLANYGLNPGAKAIKSYGNTASALGKDLSQMVEAVADAATGEFERLKEFGIKSAKEGDKVAFTFRGTTTAVKNSAQEIENYLMRLGEVDFAGNMDARMKTLDGAISNLGDSWDRFFRTVSDAGAGGAIESAVRGATSALDELDGLMRSGAAAGFAAEVGKLTAEMSAGAAMIREMTGDLDPLKIAFQTVTVLGANVAFVFRQIGSDIGAAAAAAGAAGRGEFKQALDIFRMRGEDAGRARQELDAFVDRVMAGGAALDKQTTAAGTATKALEDYRIKSGQVTQTEEQKKQAIEAYNLRLDTMTSLLREAWDELDAIAKQQQEYGKALWSGNDALEEQARRLEREVEFYGMTESAIQAVMIARLDEARAIAAINGASEDHLDFLQREIDARKRIAAASSRREALDASRKSAEDAARQWDRAAADIERALTDSLMRAFESGKDFGDAFAKSLQATFKTMLLRVTVQAVVSPVQSALGSALGVSGGSLVGQAGTSMLGSLAGSGLVSLGGALGTGTGAGGFLTGLGGALGSGSGFGGKWAAGSALSATPGGAAAGLGMQLGAVAPYIGGALALASVLGAFGDTGAPKSMIGGGGRIGPTGVSYDPTGQAHWTSYTSSDRQLASAVLTDELVKAIQKINAGYTGGAFVKGEVNVKGSSSNQSLAQVTGASGQVLYHRFLEAGKGTEDFQRFAASEIPKLQLALMVDAMRQAGGKVKQIADDVIGTAGDLTDTLQQVDAGGAMARLQEAMAAMEQQAKDTAAAAEAMNAALLAGISTALSGVEAAVDAEKRRLDAAYEEQRRAYEDQIDAAQESSAAISALAETLADAAKTVSVVTPSTRRAARTAALGGLGAALSAAQSGQSLIPFADQISEAVGVLSQPSEDLYATFDDFASEQGKAAGALAALSKHADAQKSVAQLTLDAIRSAADAAQREHIDAMARLDAQLAEQKRMVDGILGVDNSVKSVRDALQALSAAATVQAVQAGKPPPAAATPRTSAVITDTGWLVGTSGASIRVEDAVKAIRESTNPRDVYDVSIREGISAPMLDSMLGWAAGTSNAWADSQGLPRFMNGGTHSGGWAMVGENGPELAYLPPSQIFNAGDTRQMLRGDSAGEIAALRDEQRRQAAAMANTLARLTRVVERWDGDGIPETRAV